MNARFSDFLFPDSLMRGLDREGLQVPTTVQAQVIPLAMDGLDLAVSAATGSGKTAAFLLPMMQRFLDLPVEDTGTRALILVPTRELARQIYVHFIRLGRFTRLTAGVITGGESRAHQIATLRKNPEILVATPGRLLELLEHGQADLADLEILVLDEADRMLDMGFAEEVLGIIGRSNPARQSLLFSATLHHLGLNRILDSLLREPQVLVIDPIREPHPEIAHQLLLSDGLAHKQQQLLWLLKHEPFEQTLVFTNRRDGAVALGDFLVAHELRVAVLHGELSQRERNRVMGLVHGGRVGALVATDLAARGLDLPGVQLVVNFDLPRSGDDYLHRTGRTGRAGEPGVAISLVGPAEWNRMEGIARYLDLDLERRSIQGLKAAFKGITKRKRSSKPTPEGCKVSKGDTPKTKNRLRNRKNIGKRRQPSSHQGTEAGHTPLKRRSTVASKTNDGADTT